VTVDVHAGVGGLAVRYDERFHVEIEAGAGVVIARAVVADLVQEWSIPLTSEVLDLHIESRRPAAGGALPKTSDVFHLAVTTEGERRELATVDGRFLSAETTESFTGRVIGVYARSGDVAVLRWTAEGDDE